MFANIVCFNISFERRKLFARFILAIDRCYNNSGGCGKYGTCLNLPLLNSHKCQCRFLYSGDRCEKCKQIRSDFC
jgi:hypothetical protein